MANYKYEPRVVSTEQITSYTEPTPSFTDLGTLTYAQFTAEIGPEEPTLISSFSEFLSTYTLTGALSNGLPVCLLEAAYIAQSSPVLAKRVISIAEPEASTLSGDWSFLAPKQVSARNYLRLVASPLNTEKTLLSVTIYKLAPKNSQVSVDSTDINDYVTTDSEQFTVANTWESKDANGLANGLSSITDNSRFVKLASTEPVTEINMDLAANQKSVAFGRCTSEGSLLTCSASDWNDAYTELADSDELRASMIYSTTAPVTDEGYTQTSANTSAAGAGANPSFESIEDYTGIGAVTICSSGVDYSTTSYVDALKSIGTSLVNVNAVIVAGRFRNTSLTGSSIMLDAALLYHSKVCSNYAAGKPFAPVMGTQNGAISSAVELSPAFSSTTRKELLNAGIIVIRDNKSTGYKYFLDDITTRSATADDELTQTQNRRLFNKIRADIDDLLDEFIGQYNIAETQMKVEDAIDKYFREEIMILKPYTINRYFRQCDEVINTTNVVRSRLLKVIVAIGFNNSIRNIEVVYKVVPIN